MFEQPYLIIITLGPPVVLLSFFKKWLTSSSFINKLHRNKFSLGSKGSSPSRGWGRNHQAKTPLQSLGHPLYPHGVVQWHLYQFLLSSEARFFLSHCHYTQDQSFFRLIFTSKLPSPTIAKASYFLGGQTECQGAWPGALFRTRVFFLSHFH